jgi:UDP-N-acetylglucosamine 2-epimerase (non-hydrolysing)
MSSLKNWPCSNPITHFSIQGKSVVSQLAGIMNGIEGVVQEYQPDLMVVVGDVNSTLAAALVANKMGVKLAHVESGLAQLRPHHARGK